MLPKIWSTMSAKNPTRSMTSFKGHCDKKAKKIDQFLSDNPDPNPEDLQVLKKLNADLEDQLNRMRETKRYIMSPMKNRKRAFFGFKTKFGV